MSSDPFENLPDEFREMIEQMMKRLQNIPPEELNNMMSKLFGEGMLDKFRDLMTEGSNFDFPVDPNMAKNFETVMKDFMKNAGTEPYDFGKTEEVEPYYEILPHGENGGQIVVDLPGVTDLRLVNWKMDDLILSISAKIEGTSYYTQIEFEQKIRLNGPLATVKNGVFTLSYSYLN
ncbi:MAG: hypothetical protein IH840_02235 [Candidatus Heimdallarchaeota archaeon]|nr:hypothetical protein [Candidatus Heimdallarchaeota archaeon]